MADEGFHEIQLNGKQLVFLFMAATVVSVVVFLLGVMVGRNVRQPSTQIAATAADTPIDPTAEPTVRSGSTSTASDRTPLSAQETLTYPERLEAPEPPAETFNEAAAPPPVVASPPPVAETPRETVRTEPATATKVPAVTSAAAKVAAAAAAPTSAVENASFHEPGGNGWVVQVMAAVKREEAESLAQRLTAKGYPTFVSVGDGKVPAKFRVRVGKYTEKREAEAIELKLQKQEQFKTWLTR
jgi:cell division septation protein DedD